jgi:hypothetical protein
MNKVITWVFALRFDSPVSLSFDRLKFGLTLGRILVGGGIFLAAASLEEGT